jgi:hypothetical protein
VPFFYPRDLEERVRSDWPSDHPSDPLAHVRPALLEVAYQASASRDEGRPVRLRLLLATPSDRDLRGDLDDLHVLAFDRTRPCDVDELRRIAAAAPFETALVLVAPDEDGELRIWGVGWSGAQWLAPTWGGRAQRSGCYVPRTIVHVNGAGRLAVYSGERFIASLELGTLVTLATDAFTSKWLPALFADARKEMLALHERDRGESAPLDESLLMMVGQHLVRRALWLMRAARHGGMLLFAEPSEAEALCAGALRAKYRFAEGEPRARYRTLVQELTVEMSRTRPHAITARDFVNASGVKSDVEAAIFELSRLIASLSAVDGAVLLTKRFEVVGFGVEILSDTAPISEIRRALDNEGEECVPDHEENVGTRHRAAYRFVHMHPKGLAIVVSQDGTVRFVVRIKDQIKYFEQHLVG